MCWIGPNKKLIAEEDIKVKKVLQEKFIAYFHFFQYCPGETYKALFDDTNLYSDLVTIHHGFHSYSEKCPIKILKDSIKVLSLKKHTKLLNKEYNYNEVLQQYECPSIVVDFVIPKGSEYFVNEQGEYVSNQIKCIGECVGRV